MSGLHACLLLRAPNYICHPFVCLAEGEDSMSKAKRRAIKRATARDSAEAYIDEDNHLVFEGG